jgi:hypothetical protein
MGFTIEELHELGFRRAGSVVPDPAKKLRVQIDWDVRGFVVYAMVVNGEVKKLGTTGHKETWPRLFSHRSARPPTTALRPHPRVESERNA